MHDPERYPAPVYEVIRLAYDSPREGLGVIRSGHLVGRPTKSARAPARTTRAGPGFLPSRTGAAPGTWAVTSTRSPTARGTAVTGTHRFRVGVGMCSSSATAWK